MTPRDLAPVGMRCEPGIHACYQSHARKWFYCGLPLKRSLREVRIYTERNTHGSTWKFKSLSMNRPLGTEKSGHSCMHKVDFRLDDHKKWKLHKWKRNRFKARYKRCLNIQQGNPLNMAKILCQMAKNQYLGSLNLIFYQTTLQNHLSCRF